MFCVSVPSGIHIITIRVISSDRDERDSATVHGNTGSNGHEYALPLGIENTLLVGLKRPLAKEKLSWQRSLIGM